jgi:type IV pilus assembly protein PilB
MNTFARVARRSHWLSQTGLVEYPVVEQLAREASALEQSLITLLVDKGIMDAISIARTAAAHFRLPLVDLDSIDPSHLAVIGKDLALICKHRIIPLAKTDQTITLGRSDPMDESGLADIQFMTGCRPVIVVLEENKLDTFIRNLKEEGASGLPNINSLESMEPHPAAAAEDADEDAEIASTPDSPVMHFVNKLLLDAVRQHASDIHIETFEQYSRIRFRRNGMLREIARPPPSLGKKFISRLKIMSQLDIAEKRLPQDGRFKLKLPSGKTADFRISTLPALWGEKAVVRIQDHNPVQFDLESLGLDVAQKQQFLEALDKQHGLILVTGPTGSGKSMSLYAGLKHLNTMERNISTVEDPVEIHLDGVNQVSINQTIGLTFAETLRSFLRQDPDILMVGEIRDSETAEIAVCAAQTGHLVLSTLHTNTAPDTIIRLMDMGIKPLNLATSLNLVIAQRLIRRLCPACKKQVSMPANILGNEGFSEEAARDGTFFIPLGCARCQDGYAGRIGIYEVLPITDEISRVIMGSGNSKQIADLARLEGFNTLRQSALARVSQGVTSLAEANRVT